MCVPYSITLWYPHIILFRLCHGTLVWYSECYSGMPQSQQYVRCMYTLQCNFMVPSHQSISVMPWYPDILPWHGSVSHIRHSVLTPKSLWPSPYLREPTALTLWCHHSASRLCYNGTLVWLSLTNTRPRFTIERQQVVIRKFLHLISICRRALMCH